MLLRLLGEVLSCKLGEKRRSSARYKYFGSTRAAVTSQRLARQSAHWTVTSAFPHDLESL